MTIHEIDHNAQPKFLHAVLDQLLNLILFLFYAISNKINII